MYRPLGPVVVFGASNFPLAYSVAGGDTASALAAGCPVIVKAHPSHPGTSELVGLAVSEAVRECGLPEGVFSLLFGVGNELGEVLVSHPLIKAGGFTGSRTGGKALAALAANRPEPIPFYAEMSSVNPLVVLPGAMRERGEAIAAGLHGAVTLGAGQFCTKPGLIFVHDDDATAGFITRLATLMGAEQVFTLLNPGIRQAYTAGTARLDNKSVVTTLARPAINSSASADSGCQTAAALYQTTAASLHPARGWTGKAGQYSNPASWAAAWLSSCHRGHQTDSLAPSRVSFPQWCCPELSCHNPSCVAAAGPMRT
jgi:NADP-dependent aldehyde dehydrogenase